MTSDFAQLSDIHRWQTMQDFNCRKPKTAYDNRQPPIDEFEMLAFKQQSILGVG
jgi:hypothetical protein